MGPSMGPFMGPSIGPSNEPQKFSRATLDTTLWGFWLAFGRNKHVNTIMQMVLSSPQSLGLQFSAAFVFKKKFLKTFIV
jgi:hypothetical protein